MTDKQEIFYRPKQVAEILGFGIATFWRKAKTDSNFPKLIKDGRRTLVSSFDLAAYQNLIKQNGSTR